MGRASYIARVQRPLFRRACVVPNRVLTLMALTLMIAALAACGGGSDDAGDTDLTSEELFAAGDDALDLALKPPVANDYLGPVEGLVITDLVEGTGDEAASGKLVSLQYVGVLSENGNQFDASWDRGATPIEFTLGTGQVISGWDTGIVGMKVGGRRVLQIPAVQAYGSGARGGIPADSDLVFIVDLVDVQPAPPTPTPPPPPPPAPPIPEDALGSFAELATNDLVEGTGPEIERGDIVAVQYVGVDAETGEEFDSSWSRGAVPFLHIAGVPGVIEGWQEGILGMKEGGERILQIPSAMAYGQGDLVFRVHAVEITPAPPAHKLEFGGEPPSDFEVTTLTEGTGAVAEEGTVLEANLVVYRHSDSAIVQSSYETGEPAVLSLTPGAALPGFYDGILGVAEGELRQIIVPTETLFPEGVPEAAGVLPGDALVFVIEAVDVATPE